ncbi:hypothetical protein BHE90_015237 [Fusarium euwallaceae]|uniref:Uncharacterized protein n=2 Tax=Fusarium solani species complex TaxID=232080 RepID=A0A428UJ00_9HYPO|nr:hypothetical protein CEP52_001374 [Fusarium oligoseptatum]RTE70372.1 hypothetical protein BHE90_015237 [Fusarium euwallaceae]
METPRAVLLPDGVEDNDESLAEFVIREFGASFATPQSDDNGFEIVQGRIYDSHPTDRIIHFRPHKGTPKFGCIRVLRSETANQGEATKEKKGPVWDVVRAVGSYVGLVPAGCPFEAMLVQVRFIATR